MPTLRRISTNLHWFWQSPTGTMIRSQLHYGVLVLGLLSLILFGFTDKRPLPRRIETMFSITIPDSGRDFGWYTYLGHGDITLAKFTVDLADLDSALHSEGCCKTDCLNSYRESGYMPDFYPAEHLDWWHPFTATVFDGTTCYDYHLNGTATNYHLMVDYSVPGEATVYIEEYSVDKNGQRARMR